MGERERDSTSNAIKHIIPDFNILPYRINIYECYHFYYDPIAKYFRFFTRICNRITIVNGICLVCYHRNIVLLCVRACVCFLRMCFLWKVRKHFYDAHCGLNAFQPICRRVPKCVKFNYATKVLSTDLLALRDVCFLVIQPVGFFFFLISQSEQCAVAQSVALE